MERNKILFVLVNLFLFLSGCKTKSELGVNDYLAWVESPDNEINVEKTIGNFEFDIIYKPLDYVVAQESRKYNISPDSLYKRKEELKGYQYFTLSIKSVKDNEFLRTGILSENEYYKRLEYYISEAQNDIKIVEGADTIPCAMYHFERNYGISPYSHIVLSFEEKDNSNSKDKTFIYDDQVLGVGKIAIEIKAQKLNEIPKLKI